MILKNYVSAYVERWNMLLGFVFVLIVVFMPEDGAGRAALVSRRGEGRSAVTQRSRSST